MDAAPMIIEQIVASAFQYGPFFFSIWFLYAFAKWSYGNYAVIHAKKSSTSADLSNHWLYFVLSTAFGCTLVVVSIVWWIFNESQPHIFFGEIEGVDSDITMSSSEVYMRESMDPNSGDKEIHFVVVSSEPIKRGQTFRIHLKRLTNDIMRKTPNALALEYDGRRERKFLMVLDHAVPLDASGPKQGGTQ